MTREEEIIQASKEFSRDTFSIRPGLVEDSFIEGAKWAEKTMIDKACKWFENYLAEVVGFPDDWVRDSNKVINGEEQFRKDMMK